ncbi:crotonase/enoyl-CoA hydratase family protein [Acetobacter sp. AN02]|uniref:crotonase/enoyl-CoA hydratase family protein n=1 Tax=Acetobacter sp. AN02 TaxID=2894186 RepID=UPI0024341211|nr:crotonase/enoyl-CoA hydratase family protein [Acetobacter sp. AN02]MDG6095020.1 crotonase/enoyl-CoA hydratase family protein [Acetobacter sp. AN02]
MSSAALNSTFPISASVGTAAQNIMTPDSETDIAARTFSGINPATVDPIYEAAARTLWIFMQPDGRPSFTPQLLRDLHLTQATLSQVVTSAGTEARPVRHVVVASHVPGIFNLGGDLALFSKKIRENAREELRRYAHACVDVVFANADGYGHDLTTVALVQGDALGGGFEAALSCDVIIAEKDAVFGLPEVLFNLFPGMGAYTLLSRRIGMKAAEKMILSGQTYSAGELHTMGIVDVLAEPGEGEAAVRDYLSRLDRRYNSHHAMSRVRQHVNPVSHQELRDVTDIWVDAAMKLTDLYQPFLDQTHGVPIGLKM